MLLGWAGYTQYSFTLTNPPFDGICNSTPATGKAAKTYFDISCHNLKGADSTFQYSISLAKSTSKVGGRLDDADSVLLLYGSRPHMTVTLPAGPKHNSHLQKLTIRIFDAYGASTQVFLTLKVLMSYYIV